MDALRKSVVSLKHLNVSSLYQYIKANWNFIAGFRIFGLLQSGLCVTPGIYARSLYHRLLCITCISMADPPALLLPPYAFLAIPPNRVFTLLCCFSSGVPCLLLFFFYA